MTNLQCTYDGDREGTLIAYLYDDIDTAGRAAFEAHLAGCARCRVELTGLRGVRSQLDRWEPPQPSMLVARTGAEQPSAGAGITAASWRNPPAWAQVAAALLFVGVAAGIANLDVRYDSSGMAIHTGWSRPAAPAARAAAPVETPAPAVAVVEAASKSDLAALERQLRQELRAIQTASTRATAPDGETLRKVRALVDESERRQQRELALRLAQAVTDMNAQRQGDLRRMQVSLSGVQRDLGVEVLRQQERVNYLMRVNQRQ